MKKLTYLVTLLPIVLLSTFAVSMYSKLLNSEVSARGSECTKNSDCSLYGSNYKCIQGLCVPYCSKNSDCGNNEICIGNRCEPQSTTPPDQGPINCPAGVTDCSQMGWYSTQENSNDSPYCLNGQRCKYVRDECMNAPTVPQSTKWCFLRKRLVCTDDPTCGTTSTTAPTTRPTPTTPPVTGQCTNLKIYLQDWTQITPAQFSDLAPKVPVYFCVGGTTSGGSFDMARFTINSIQYANTTLKKPGTNDYCMQFIIPFATVNFAVQGELHHVTLGWL